MPGPNGKKRKLKTTRVPEPVETESGIQTWSQWSEWTKAKAKAQVPADLLPARPPVRPPANRRRVLGGARAMDRFEKLAKLGEGSYGTVFKCRVRDTEQLVAIKRFTDSEDDPYIRKIAIREVQMLKKLRHDNLVNLIEVFRRRKRIHLVFEYCEFTLLDEINKHRKGLKMEKVRKITYQLLSGIGYCHQSSVVHRDVKPENILISTRGIIKVCDFGFARMLLGPNAEYTEYVATRWYRAPELLVRDCRYGSTVDIWALGCVIGELVTGDPIWPGQSDVDQLFLIQKTLGEIPEPLMRKLFNNVMVRMPTKEEKEGSRSVGTLAQIYKGSPPELIRFLEDCLRLNPEERHSCSELLDSGFFHDFGYYEQELRGDIQREREAGIIVDTKNDESTRSTVGLTGGGMGGGGGGVTLPQLTSDSLTELAAAHTRKKDKPPPPPQRAPTKLPTIEGGASQFFK
eukprot:scpid37559/ scgid4439/ Cyclin-dependent kinase-like 4